MFLEFYSSKLISHVVISLISRQAINHNSARDCKFTGIGIECVNLKNVGIIVMAKVIYGINPLKWLSFIIRVLSSKGKVSVCLQSSFLLIKFNGVISTRSIDNHDKNKNNNVVFIKR